MNYNEALEYIHSVEWLGSKPGLSRTQTLLLQLGNPEKNMKFIHVAGTNGKGSTCSMCDSVLRAAGYKVGLYTSPYIVRFNERMCVDGVPIADDELAMLVAEIKPIADSMEDKPTEFELITAIAFLYFKRHECDIVVLEVGMGGRLDSTNVIESPVVSVITGIAIDHTSVLGNTVAEIANEKAGIIKPNCPVVYGGRDDVAFEVIRSKAKETGSDVVRTSLDTVNVKEMNVTGTVFDYDGMKDIKLSLCGSYQPENASTVIEIMRVLNRRGFVIGDGALRNGLAKARWRARFELLDSNPITVFDGSHNLQGVTAVAESVRRFFDGEKTVVLMGVLADKEWEKMVEIICGFAERFVCVTPNSPRALNSASLAEKGKSLGVDSYAANSIDDGVAIAYSEAKRLNRPLVMLGSLYMYGDAANGLEKAKEFIK